MRANWIRLAVTLLVLGSIGGLLRSQQPAARPGAPQAVLIQYCIGCHNAKLKTGGLALDALSPGNVQEHTDIWEKVVLKLRARYMPPPGLPRPDDRTYNDLVSYLEASLD